jgi:hypothetical protein
MIGRSFITVSTDIRSITGVREVYMTPRKCKIMRIMAMTISVWIQPPVWGILGLMRRPKKPSSHRITRITMIVPSIIILLLYDQQRIIRLIDRMAVGLTARLTS